MATEIQVSCECFESDKLIFHWKRFLEERLDLVTTMVKKKKTTKNWYRYTSVLASQLSSNLLYAYCQVTNVKFFLCPRCENTCKPLICSKPLSGWLHDRKEIQNLWDYRWVQLESYSGIMWKETRTHHLHNKSSPVCLQSSWFPLFLYRSSIFNIRRWIDF